MGEGTQKPFPCVDCDKNFCTRYQLAKHQLSHSGEKPHKCQADGCVEAFVTHSSMKNHMFKMHQNKGKPYKVYSYLVPVNMRCIIECTFVSYQEASCWLEVMDWHVCVVMRLRSSQCGHQGCGADFNKKHQLKAHTYEHTKLLPFQ
ncbi:hypothetical protein CRUP_011080 [Coryphaenoides rupestris]|nr:hypothetical protein CRUP_011080 [Coryphaenoides rupestris]